MSDPPGTVHDMTTMTTQMRVRVHRGCHEVGGTCVEVEAGGSRLVLDVGRPLTSGTDETIALPDVPGLADGSDPSLLGVLISHGHLDHYGLIDQVHPSVPVYAGQAASAVVEAARFFSPRGPALRPSGYLVDGQTFELGPFVVTPHLVDHSAFDAYAFVVEAAGRRLMYTGDLRGHGRKRSFASMLETPPAGIDTLLMEGTHVGSERAEPRTETHVELDLADSFRSTAGLAVVASSAQNVDRLVTVYRAARRAGRTLLVDLYSAAVAEATGRPTIPRPGFPGLGVWAPRRQRVQVKESGEFHRTAAVRRYRAFTEQLVAHPERYVVLGGSSAAHELLRDGALTAGGTLVWSMWSGYLAEPSGVRLRDAARLAGVPLVEHHTSGHASVKDLRRLVEAVNPAVVVPIHTDGADEFARHFPRTAPQHDGVWWSV